MKRKISKMIETIKRKGMLCLVLAGFTMINTGFTAQEDFPRIEPAQIEVEETSAEPTAIAVGENGQLKLSEDNETALAYAEIVEKSLGSEISENGEFIEETPPEDIIETPQGYVSYVQTMNMEATAYLPTDGSGEGLTAMGIPATYGIVAVDPDVIPLGSRVYIPGYGEALAADTGGAIYGYRIDLCMEDYYAAMDFGRRNVTVFVLK